MKRFLLGCLIWGYFAVTSYAADPYKGIHASVRSTLKSSSGQIRQFAFDNDPNTYFASAEKPGKEDHFTLQLDQPIPLQSIVVTTGNPQGEYKLKTGKLLLSADGKKFTSFDKFQDGKIKANVQGKIKLIRIQPGESEFPLVIREIEIVSVPAVARYKYPVEFNVDISDAPEMKEWTEKVVDACERNYFMINEQLKSDGFKPSTIINLRMKKDYNGVAEASGNNILGSTKFFKEHPEDIGAMIHETVHVVQLYRTRNAPDWLVEGIADYVRYFKYEPGKPGGQIGESQAKYDGSYRVSATFLNYVAEKYDKNLVFKLNKALREGEYTEQIFQTLTKKSLKQLNEEWRASLRKR